jgi:hypothetical protein
MADFNKILPDDIFDLARHANLFVKLLAIIILELDAIRCQHVPKKDKKEYR